MYGAKVWPHLAQVAESASTNSTSDSSHAQADFSAGRVTQAGCCSAIFAQRHCTTSRLRQTSLHDVLDSINGVLEVIDQSEGSDVFYAWDIFFTTYLVILSDHVRHIRESILCR